jgi:putative membrane-bound dehydrogenase-like protein
VIDPVEIRFDEDGRMWVVEMRDYPSGSPDGIRHSRISVLKDRDRDGFFETATVFADDLHFATGIQPWKGGVFVTMAGQIAYMKDTTRDDKADVNETWYTGFAEENTQLRANHPRLALDNYVYVANGLRGGTIVDAQRPGAKPLSISGMDFRFNLITRECEAVSGAGQFGLTFDDYGNRFTCSNRNPAIHVVMEDHFLKRNPLVAVSAVTQDVAKAGDASSVFPISRAWTTSNLHAGQFTAACGLEFYRGVALPAEFYGNIFVCEPTGHLVHREVVKPLGVTFCSTPAYDKAEFFASRDEWCCPVNMEVGPDGALYVVDMYRAVIEHPEWMPVELRDRSDLLDGNDRGRIYRIVPQNFQRPPAPKLSNLPSAGLVELLAHPSDWWRETAARLLFERQDKHVAPLLEHIAIHHQSPLARMHALRVLQGLDLVTEDLCSRMLNDSHPRVVEQTVAVAQPHLSRDGQLPRRLANLTAHEDARVRFQSLLSGNAVPSPPQHRADSWEVDAMLIAARNQGGTVLNEMLRKQPLLEANIANPKQFIAKLARSAAATRDNDQMTIAVHALLSNDTYRRVGLASVLQEARRHDASLPKLQASLTDAARHSLDQAFADARVDAADTSQPEHIRGEAIDLLACSDESMPVLTTLAEDDSSPMIRARAIQALSLSSELEPWRRLLNRLANETPSLQAAILEGVLASSARTSLLLELVADGSIKTALLDTNRVSRLLHYRDADIKSRAQTLLADVVPADRQQALSDYQVVLTMKTKAERGRAVFQKHCATCHRIDDIGVDIAPDISDSREKSAQQLLTDIILPNRTIDSNYFSYTAITHDGQVHTGVLTAETSTSVTFRQAEGKTVSLRRSEIEGLHSNGVSLMPDGLEKLIPPQEMADLISFIKNWRYLNIEK